jgi:hypothetical protein
MAFNVKGGSQGHGGESWGSLMPPEWGDPTVCRAWPGFGTTFSNLLNNVPPYVVDNVGFRGADHVATTLSGFRPGTSLPPHVP